MRDRPHDELLGDVDTNQVEIIVAVDFEKVVPRKFEVQKVIKGHLIKFHKIKFELWKM